MLDKFLWVGFPYVALVLAIVVSILRFVWKPFSYSSLSSQFLENKQLFWGSGLWHWGIVWVLTGHLVAFLIPGQILAWNSAPFRLYLLEFTGLTAALLALVGIVALMVRRHTSSRVKVVTTAMDWILLGFLLLQVTTGIDTALRYRWGSSWYASNAAPYLWSLLSLSPRPELIVPLPWLPKIHILSGFSVILLIPFTRLVHFLVVPIFYYWRKPQVVIWNRKGLR
ncbi:MAG: respiratory nitrate reductase subunit gamma [Geothrix sp.]|uniref:Respiratory nitrate reductase subunit gamma n=2 Tax=Geothrix TaxID=44675 RepID=A0A936F3S7_9BACT|nr:respiratory nitrate reductase subunit gamma [Holophagaceae bacterium]MBK8573597.1 respiratory nitrate reductase subunit gamma [Candidatus Geothrix odensensis]MBK9797270.1 respiratory nitrate reductase subunit gamma [Candidatus Geothrix skivensis]MCE1205685.1 respiratory nitrate reductase subunit gamma [Holophagaceae bacterium]